MGADAARVGLTLLPLWRCQWLGAVGSQAHCGALVARPARPIAGLAVSEADDCVRQQPRHSGTILVSLCQTLDPCLAVSA